MTGFTPGPWQQGRTLKTRQTQKWTSAQLEQNDAFERKRVFADFSDVDEGRSRRLIAVCERDEDAQLIVEAPNMLAALKGIREEFEKLKEAVMARDDMPFLDKFRDALYLDAVLAVIASRADAIVARAEGKAL